MGDKKVTFFNFLLIFFRFTIKTLYAKSIERAQNFVRISWYLSDNGGSKVFYLEVEFTNYKLVG